MKHNQRRGAAWILPVVALLLAGYMMPCVLGET